MKELINKLDLLTKEMNNKLKKAQEEQQKLNILKNKFNKDKKELEKIIENHYKKYNEKINEVNNLQNIIKNKLREEQNKDINNIYFNKKD